MPFNRRMDKENVVIYTMEYYAAEKNNDIMKFAGKWMELENVILSEPLMKSHASVQSHSGFKCQPLQDTSNLHRLSLGILYPHQVKQGSLVLHAEEPQLCGAGCQVPAVRDSVEACSPEPCGSGYSRCPSREEWIRKMWFIYTMEYYAAEKKNDIMKFAGKWMELENVILSEVPMEASRGHWILLELESQMIGNPYGCGQWKPGPLQQQQQQQQQHMLLTAQPSLQPPIVAMLQNSLSSLKT
ncbi:hypothetical protein STEG23_032715 [Scotinomys teguina]